MHTPGPWFVQADGAGWCVECTPERGHSIAYIRGAEWEDEPDTSNDEKEANARLIAAAPVMLAALRSMRCAIEAQILGAKAARHGPDVEVIDTFIEDCQDDLDLINDAITRATGEQA